LNQNAVNKKANRLYHSTFKNSKKKFDERRFSKMPIIYLLDSAINC
jgi:hypothetical protein